MKTTKPNTQLTLEQFKDKHYGKPGTTERDRLENGYKQFQISASNQVKKSLS